MELVFLRHIQQGRPEPQLDSGEDGPLGVLAF